jgi:excisionase family DNA binding protein
MNADTKIEPLFLRVSATARLLNMSRTSVYELIRQGILPATKIGGKLRVPVAGLERLANEALNGQREQSERK